MYHAEDGFITPIAENTKFVLSIYEAPLPPATGFAAYRSSFRRSDLDQAPTEAKASCLYPNVARAVQETRDKGFDTAVVLDPAGHVAELAYTNLFFSVGGKVITPAPNGIFLNGITKQRVIQILRDDGAEATEPGVDYAELADADELFSTASYSKIMPCTRLDERDLVWAGGIGDVWSVEHEFVYIGQEQLEKFGVDEKFSPANLCLRQHTDIDQ